MFSLVSSLFYHMPKNKFYQSLTSAVAALGIPMVTALADAAVGALSVVQAFPALSGAPITWVQVGEVNVVAALAGLATPTGLWGVAIVTGRTLLAARAWWDERAPFNLRSRKRKLPNQTGRESISEDSSFHSSPHQRKLLPTGFKTDQVRNLTEHDWFNRYGPEQELPGETETWLYQENSCCVEAAKYLFTQILNYSFILDHWYSL